jgi:DNA transposition AAA+ family ATPase
MSVLSRIQEFLEDTKYSQGALARQVDYSAATISHYLKGTYNGDTKKLEIALDAFLKRHEEKSKENRSKVEFINTSVAEKCYEVCRYSHVQNEIGVIVGNAGLGKTMAVKNYTTQNPGTILIEVDLGYTPKVLMQEIHRALGMSGIGHVHTLFVDIVEKLIDSDRMILVDEAEYLPYKALELLRRLHDKSGVGLVLCGLPRLISNLKGSKGEFAQLYSRVGISAKLNHLTMHDTKMFVEREIPSSNGIAKHFHHESNGNARRLHKMLKRAPVIARQSQMDINAEIVKATLQTLIH